MKHKIFCHLMASVCGMMLLGVASCEKMNVSASDAGEEDVSVTVRVTSFEQGAILPRGVGSQQCWQSDFDPFGEDTVFQRNRLYGHIPLCRQSDSGR